MLHLRQLLPQLLQLPQRLTWIALASCLMLGCASGKRPMLDLEPALKIAPPASLAQAPAALPLALSGRWADLESNHRAVAKHYHLLASQHCQLLAFLEMHPPACNPWLVTTPPIN